MNISEARYKANKKWNKENLERIEIQVKKGRKAEIKAAADASGESVNAYITGAVDMRMGTPRGLHESQNFSYNPPE